MLKKASIGITSLANRIGKIVEGISDITIQNGTPYAIRVKTRYIGQNKFLGICTPDDFILESVSNAVWKCLRWGNVVSDTW